jgi:hypothetical protein
MTESGRTSKTLSLLSWADDGTDALIHPEIKHCQLDVVDTTKEDGNHGHFEAPKSTLHPRETPV